MIDNTRIFKNLTIYKSLMNIILNNPPKGKLKLLGHFSNKKTIELAKIVLTKEESYYGVILDKLIEQNGIKFELWNSSNYNISKNKIEIYNTKTLDDLFALIHELIHFCNYSCDKNEIQYLFNEVLPILYEYKTYEYLKDTNLSEESYYEINNIFLDNYLLANNSKLELELYKLFKNEVDYDEVPLELKKYYFNTKKNINTIEIDNYGRYLFATILSVYINKCLNDGSISLDNFRIFKDNINNLSIEDINSLLNINLKLDSDGLFISNEELDKFNFAYKLEMKRYNV